jgi:hypothetical protein
MSEILKESDAQKYLRENAPTSVRNSACWDWEENAKLLLDDPETAVKAFGYEWLTMIAKDALLWDSERKKLANAVVEVIGKLDEIIEQVEEITLHDVNYFAVPAELWHELEDALEKMPERAESFLAAPQQAIPSGWKLALDHVKAAHSKMEAGFKAIPDMNCSYAAKAMGHINEAMEILSASPTAPIDNVAEALEKIVKGIDKLATTIEGEVNYANTDSTNQLMGIIAVQLRALIPDTQAKKGEDDALNAYSSKPQNPVSVHTDSDSN